MGHTTALADTARQTSVLSTGVSVVSASANTPVSVEIEGRTLISLPNTSLETGKKYVLADKKTKVIVDGVTHSGVAKFTKTGEAGRATVIRVENFEGKVSGSNVENAHVAYKKSSATLVNPTALLTSDENSQAGYNLLNKLDGAINPFITSINGDMAQQPFKKNLIEAVERNIGRIPRTTVADKVAWLKVNVAKLTGNWRGFGSSVGGNKAYFDVWANGRWDGYPSTNTSSTSTALSRSYTTTAHVLIDANGFVHYIVYAEPSNGTIPSVINTDYIDLEIELKPDADFTNPKVPLYEVSDADYNKILVDWNADEVMRRYPVVEGVQHLQGVGVFAEGDNLFSPFTEWELSANTRVVSPYELELIVTSATNFTSILRVNVKPNTQYSINMESNGYYAVADELRYTNKLAYGTGPRTFNSGSDTKIVIAISNYFTASQLGTFIFKNPMLTLGTVAKPFVPRNTSSVIADVKLGAIGDKKDILYQGDNNTWLLRKAIEKDVVLDGNFGWKDLNKNTGVKGFSVSPNGLTPSNAVILSKNNGNLSSKLSTVASPDTYWAHSSGDLYMGVANSDTGFSDGTVLTASDIKRYFNGWKYSNGTVWNSVTGNGQTATAQIALDTKPTDYTPYKLSYVLATPTITDVTDKVEGALKVNGLTQVEVMSGAIRREKAVPVLYGQYQINNPNAIGSLLKNKTDRIIAVYKNGQIDLSWEIITNTIGGAFGKQRATLKDNSLYSSTAEYTITYIVLDKHLLTGNPTNVKLTYAQNIRGAVDDISGVVQDNSTMLSVHEKAIVDLYVRVKALEVR